ncbi:MAG: dihydroneopterin aldolase [Chloroflexi bacterium]|nr:dihydroneopterin aldolase [Chloroflexota bacterium]
MSDRIELRAMRFAGRHGVLPFEAVDAQPFEVDVVLELDLAPAGRADDLSRTVDYGAVFAAAREVVEGPHAALLETLAERIAAAVLAAHPPVAAAVVRVRKLRPPLPGELAWAGVEVRRTR